MKFAAKKKPTIDVNAVLVGSAGLLPTLTMPIAGEPVSAVGAQVLFAHLSRQYDKACEKAKAIHKAMLIIEDQMMDEHADAQMLDEVVALKNVEDFVGRLDVGEPLAPVKKAKRGRPAGSKKVAKNPRVVALAKVKDAKKKSHLSDAGRAAVAAAQKARWAKKKKDEKRAAAKAAIVARGWTPTELAMSEEEMRQLATANRG